MIIRGVVDMKKKAVFIKYILMLLILVISEKVISKPVIAQAAPRYKLLNDLYPGYLDYACEDNGIVYMPLNEIKYYKGDGGYNDASYETVSSDRSVVDINRGFIGKKKGIAVLTLKKYEDGKSTVLYQTQVVVGQPRFYVREFNIGLGGGLPNLKDPDVLLGCQYDDKKYQYAYSIHDSSIIKKEETVKDHLGNSYDIYRAVKYGSTKVDVLEIYNGKKRVIDTFTLNVMRPELSIGDGAEVVYRMSHPETFWRMAKLRYDSYPDNYKLVYEIEDTSIISKKKSGGFILEKVGSTKVRIYCMLDDEKYYLGTVKVTILP